MVSRRGESGFALPTVVLAALMVLITLAAALSVLSGTRAAVNEQYYGQLTREAAEAGLMMAEACLETNNYQPLWGTAGADLRPNSGCSGSATQCTASDCYVLSNTQVRTKFNVPTPVAQVGYQLVTATGTMELLRSDGSVWQTQTVTLRSRVGAVVSFNNVVYGYIFNNSSQDSGFFFSLTADGKVKALGGNAYGQLGVGNTSSTTTPKTVILPGGSAPVTAVYTSGLSHGFGSFFILSDGSIYGAGRNGEGALGLNNTTTPQSTPQRLSYYEGGTSKYFGATGNKKAKYAATLGYTSFILSEDGYLFSAGSCGQGIIGRACSNATRFVQMSNLSPGSSNTKPTTGMEIDYYSAYVVTEGGRVYGWGSNERGQMANGTRTNNTVPTKIGTYGDSSQPTAVQVAFDGETLFVVGSDGKVYGSGSNLYGEIGKQYVRVVNQDAENSGANGYNKCMDGNSVEMYLLTCSSGNTWQKFEFRTSDNTIRRITDVGTTECMDDGDGTTPKFASCNGSQDQKFVMYPSKGFSIKGLKTGKCLENAGGLDDEIVLYACSSGDPTMTWWIKDELDLTQFPLPGSAGNAVKVVADQWSTLVLGSTGEVWGAGLNASGQLGNGQINEVQNTPVKFILPVVGGVQVKAVDIFHAAAGMNFGTDYNYKYANTFVLGDDGRVYGAGDNDDGQLGIGSTSSSVSTPVAMNVIDGVTIRAKQVRTGFGTTVVLTEKGEIYTVGNNSHGQLGDGTTNDNSTPKANIYTNFIPRITF